VHKFSLWTSSDFAESRENPGNDAEIDLDFRFAGDVAGDFDIELERQAKQPVVAHVRGSVDLLTAPELRRCLDDNVATATGLVVDLTSVDFLGAVGLTVLTDTDRRAVRDHLAWAMVANTRPVLRPLEVLGLCGTLPTYGNVPDAVAAVRAAAPAI
jgi:anti-sigma B factor antagonist